MTSKQPHKSSDKTAPTLPSDALPTAKSHSGAPEGKQDAARARNGHDTQAKPLRFAALRRVSTEQQEKIGESLRTQTADIEESVAELGGIISGWYGGQEHATPGYEKKELQRLLTDAQQDPRKFDAVIVAHPDRWSRDNATSRQGLEVFKENGIRFFAGGTEYDLFNPDHELFLGISAVVGQFQARNQMRKSMLNRIARAKRGIPTSGKLPYGRIYVRSKDRQSGHWELDPEKHQIIKDAAKRYLAGESIDGIAKAYDMNPSNLHKILTKVSGPTWQQEFTSKVLNIHEVVTLTIPELLPAQTIAALRARVESNRTFTRGHIKYQYLFARMIRCTHCGYAMFGQTNHQKHRYYRHAHHDRDKVCPGPATKAWVPAEEVEDTAMRCLFHTFGNPTAVRRAIEAATPNDDKIRAALQRREQAEKEKDKAEARVQRIIKLFSDASISEKDAKFQIAKNKERIQSLDAELTRLNDELKNLPNPEKLRAASQQIAGRFREYTNARVTVKTRHANEAFDEMTYAEKRELCQMVFSGRTAAGHKMGISISWDASGKKWKCHLEGLMIDETGPWKKEHFVFGGPHLQKAIVTKKALY